MTESALHPLRRCGWPLRLRWTLVLVLACAAWATLAQANQGDTRTTIYVGSTEIDIGDAYSTGTTLGVKWAYEVRDNLEWSVGGAYTTTDGQQDVASQNYAISADTTSLQTGLTYYFNRHPNSLVVPFLGIGLAAVNYAVDYRYPGSLVGKTSGVAPGIFDQAGVELWLARSVTLILELEEAGYGITDQGGRSDTLATGGLLLAIRINIY